MRLFKRSGAGAAIVALAALLSTPARADELVVMPYSCSMSGGQPVLTPGPEQGHRVIGPRDQRKFQACSPVNPGMCRSWTVHRFDLDCDGQRVSWVSVIAATSEGARRAWLLDGRLLLRMGARWSLAPDDPCAQEGDERPIYGGQLRRQCAERLASAPPPVVEMPFGYAPTLGVDAIFVTAAPVPPGGAKTSSALPPIVAGVPPPKLAAPDAPPSTDRDAKAGEAKVGDSRPKEALLPPPPPPMPAPQPVPKVASAPQVPPTPPVAEDAPRKVEAEPKSSKVAVATPPPAKEAPAPVSHGPRIVTLPPPPVSPAAKADAPEAPTVSDVQKKAEPSESKLGTSGPSPAPKVAVASPAATVEPPAPTGKVVAPTNPDGETEGGGGPGVLGLFRTTTATGAIVAFAGLALGLLAAFALARRREHAEDAGRRRRDISALSLDGKRGAKPAARTGADPRPRAKPGVGGKAHVGAEIAAPASSGTDAQPAPALKPPVAQSQPPDLMGRLAMAEVAADWSDRMPRTREEALDVLGIGIAPSANATAIKKIVDGLRMSWHPDLATDETDRALREHRSKQINAAWDILQSQQAEV